MKQLATLAIHPFISICVSMLQRVIDPDADISVNFDGNNSADLFGVFGGDFYTTKIKEFMEETFVGDFLFAHEKKSDYDMRKSLEPC